MNKDLIKKHKTEFDHWLNDSELLCLLDNPDENWFKVSKDTKIWEDNYDRDIKSIIIDDEYVEFRKALAEGKTIQIQNKFNQEFTDLDNAIFSGPVIYYRVKPEEPKFKVGDFVRDLSDADVFQLDKSFTEQLNKDSQNCIKWTPQAGELCVYPNGLNSFSCSKFISSEEQPLGKSIITLALFENGDSYDILGVEPFLNSKPSWVKN